MLQFREVQFDVFERREAYYPPNIEALFLTDTKPTQVRFSTSGLAPDSMIETEFGFVQARDIRVGMRVVTRDNGLQPVLWAGRNRNVFEKYSDAPVRVRPGVLSVSADGDSLLLPPGQRILLRHALNELLFGSYHVQIRAIDLMHVDGVDLVQRNSVNWCHILFASNEILRANGVWVESFLPDLHDITSADPQAAEEIFEAAPKLRFEHGISAYVSAYPVLNDREAGLLDFSSH